MPDTGDATDTARRSTKRLILLLDGTWNDEAFGAADTNIVRLQTIIEKTLHKQEAAKSAPKRDGIARSFNDENYFDNLVFYQRGVGTEWRNRYSGGVFGEGLDDKVRAAYNFLSFHYEPSAQIFIFGFSRGSFTARSLVGYIAAAGLLTRENCTPDNERKAWGFYRTAPAQRLPGVWSELQRLTHPLRTFQIECIGVFDTVGALGIPLARFKLLNRDSFEFHNVELSSITQLNLHAVAIDEHRNPFEASLWRRPPFKVFSSVTEQVWFPGVHADIGGGYIPETDRASGFPNALDDITLDWMLRRVLHSYPEFPADPDFWPKPDAAWATAPQDESRDGIYLALRKTLRSIANYALPAKNWFEYNGCYDRHATSMCEKVHISALQRLGHWVERRGTMRGLMHRYEPANLMASLPHILGTYHAPGVTSPSGASIRVVDWSGDDLDPDEPEHCRTVIAEIAEARKRLSGD
ncbi:MAG: DUF2235 domain-containing protein [Proteobacteria bacterium]|nr:DUF2235 domain-containing protein [Pseudomonadota bacterium]